MTDVEEKPKRKSVAFSEGQTVIDGYGSVKEMNGLDGEKETAESHTNGTQDAAVDEMTDMFKDLAKKKKKKPKKMEEADEEKPEEPAEGEDGELDLSALKKKKKKKKPKDEDEDFEAKLEAAQSGEVKAERDEPVEEGDFIQGTGIWAHDSTKPIPYPLLLHRFFTLLHEKRPELGGQISKSMKIPPPSCLREGNKKTIFANLPEIAKRLNRSEEHLSQFLFAEMGTSGSLDGSRRLVIKGRFQSKQIENILRRYILEYVICKTCLSPSTELSKGENRLYFVTCNSCGSRQVHYFQYSRLCTNLHLGDQYKLSRLGSVLKLERGSDNRSKMCYDGTLMQWYQCAWSAIELPTLGLHFVAEWSTR